ncbi:uncharacterized protein LOC111293724 isoform X3 [Durio zibethinus]|uniref:Uncharacterized protein LOC111293724 isoform X3 n=1 Tax=Durio zibethinus TaxID=66656 RepID=A0A6P5YPZ1_DURZI|nr:uncharacterized protein LOC111293724 isoform X3 [Durio zibethinus]
MDEVGPSNQGEPQGASELGSDEGSAVRWRPRQLVFGPYSPKNEADRKLRVVVRRPLVARLTKDIIETYQICNPQFKYSEELNPKRFLTSPSVGVLNDGYDNVNSDLILTVNFVLINLDTQRRYIVKDVLGHGTFGQVAKCWVPATSCFVALKIIKNQPAYYQQALVEVSILTTLNKKYDPEDKHHIVRIYDYFVYQHHLCICFELLDTNLYELIKINHFRGLSLSIVQLFSKQILRGLALLKDAAIIHCDLKPENILLCTSVKPAEIKIIDFGSACMEDRTVYSYIQSRYYRSPEVLLGYQYTTAIDMWSFGCIVAELFLGLPLFPGASEFDILRRMIEILGEQPPDYVLKEAKNTTKFFKCIGSIHNIENGEVYIGGRSAYQALTEEEYAAPVAQNIKVDHHPGGGHWFAAGLSPNIPNRNRVAFHNSPHFPMVPYGHANSYGSIGSHGSYNDNIGLGSSYGSYGDSSNMFAYYSPVGPSAMNMHAQSGASMFGSSPDARLRIMQYSHGNGLGVSPSAGNFAPLPLGTSPSQFTPPSSYSQVSGGSPGQYGPTSPARNSCQGSPLSKMAAAGQFNRRKSWGYSGSSQSQESSSSNWQGQVTDGTISSQAEGNSQVVGGLPSHIQSNSNTANWKQQRGGIGIATGYSIVQNIPNSIGLGSNVQLQHSTGGTQDKSEASMSLPDPADWDPNYSDELLLQEEISDESCISADFNRGMHIGLADSSVGVGRFNRTSSISSNLSIQRQNGPIGFSHVEVGSPPSANDMHAGHPRFMSKHSQFMPHMTQNSPSRLGQQTVHRFNHGRSTGGRGSEWNHVKVQLPPSSLNSGGPRSPGNSSFSNGMPWGRRANHPVSNIPPASRGRKDYGRIA